MSAARRARAGFCMSLLMNACGGSGEGLDANGRPLDSGGDRGVLTADLRSIQSNVFTPHCVQCHTGASAPMGLRLDETSSYGALVGVPSSEVPGLLRVEPGEPGNSYLVQKLEGRAAVGARMPLDLPALPDATIEVIRQWITAGAPNEAAAEGTLLAVQTVSVSAAWLAVAMTRSVDTSLVNDTTVALEQSPGTSAAQTVPARVSVSPHNDALIVLVPQRTLQPGRYRVSLRGTGAAALADWNAVVVDGDDDGVPGGDWAANLVIGDTP